MASKKSKNPFRFLTAESLGIPTNIAVGPLGFRAALDVNPEDGNNPKPSQIIFRETESGPQEPPVPGTSNTVAIHDIEQDLPTGGTIAHIIQEDEPAAELKVPEQDERDCRSATLGVPAIRTDVEEESAGGFGPLKTLLEVISIVYANREKSFAAKNKVEWLLSRVASLNELFGTSPGYVDENERRDRIIRDLEGIEGQLRSLSEEPGFQCLIDHPQHEGDIFRLLEDLREAIFRYQMARQTEFCNQELSSIDLAESAIINDLCRAQEAEYRHGNRNHCLKGTRVTVLDEIELWARNFHDPPVYWLNGLAGTGKSTIAQTIAERLFAEGQLGASFFCSRDFEDRRNIRFIFPTIAAQLARKYPEIRSVLVPLVRPDPGVARETPEGQMNKLIVQPFRKSGISTVIVIDALDECEDDEPASAILSVLGQFVKEIPKVKFFVTSRPVSHILNGIHLSLSAEAREVFVLHEVQQSQVNSDVRLFYEHNFSEIKSRRYGLDNWPTGEQLEFLCQRAAGLFIYATAMVRFIDQKNKNPRRQLDQLIQSQESGFEGRAKLKGDVTLDSFYILILHEAFGGGDPEDDAKVRSVLGAVILAINPLSPSTIAELLGLDLEDVLPLLSSLRSLLIFSEDINQPVQPFHKSFSDFIVDPARCADPSFCVSPPDQHAELVVGCLELMNRKLGSGVCKLPRRIFEPPYSDRNRMTKQLIGEALKYACGSWDNHLGNVTPTQKPKITPVLCKFLEEKVLFWLEVQNALSHLALAFDTLTTAITSLGILHLSLRPGGSPPKPPMASSSYSSNGMISSSTPDQSRSSILDAGVHVVAPKENESHIQEIYPPLSLICHPGSFSDEAEINRLDGVLEQGSVDERERARVLNRLCGLCCSHQNVPESAKIANCYDQSMDCSGQSTEGYDLSMDGPMDGYYTGTASVFKGAYHGLLAAVHVSRRPSSGSLTLRKFCKEAVIWRHLRHPNILPLIGVTISPERCSFVSEWTDKGTILRFIGKYPDANRIDLLTDVVKGLMYMHELHVVHGGLRGQNIFINQGGRVWLTDFGFSTVVGLDIHLDPSDINILDPNQMATIFKGRVEWTSPELLDWNYRPTKESDVYALGMVIYGVLCRTAPFNGLSPAKVAIEVLNGTRPAKPGDVARLGFTHGLWEIVEQCWLADRNARPTLEAVLSCLREAAPKWDDRGEGV